VDGAVEARGRFDLGADDTGVDPGRPQVERGAPHRDAALEGVADVEVGAGGDGGAGR